MKNKPRRTGARLHRQRETSPDLRISRALRRSFLKPIRGGYGGCLHCGYQHEILPMSAVLAVGLGIATLERDNEVIIDGETEYNRGHVVTASDAECRARIDPNHDWRIHLVSPMSDRHYQRQGPEHWVLYQKGMGFEE